MAEDSIIIRDDAGNNHVFPAGFDPQKAIAIVKAGSETAGSTEPRPSAISTSPTSPALAIKTIGESSPAVADAAMQVATNPAVPKVAAKIGRVVGGLAPVIGGAAEAGAGGAAIGAAGAASGAWAGGKTGWFTGKLIQNLSAPVASALEKLAPYAEAIASSPVLAAQSGLDIAQTLEPNRRDIGIMGVGSSMKPSALSPNEQAATISSIHGLLEKGVPMGHPVIQGLLMKLPQDVIQAIGHEAQAQKAQAQP